MVAPCFDDRATNVWTFWNHSDGAQGYRKNIAAVGVRYIYRHFYFFFLGFVWLQFHDLLGYYESLISFFSLVLHVESVCGHCRLCAMFFWVVVIHPCLFSSSLVFRCRIKSHLLYGHCICSLMIMTKTILFVFFSIIVICNPAWLRFGTLILLWIINWSSYNRGSCLSSIYLSLRVKIFNEHL